MPANDNRTYARAAYHEAGHAVIGERFGSVKEVLIDSPQTGFTHWVMHRTSERDFNHASVLVTMAGPISAARRMKKGLFFEYLAGGGIGRDDGDYEKIEKALGSLYPNQDKTSRTLTHRVFDRYARMLVRENWPAIDRVARALIDERKLSGRQVRKLVNLAR